MKREMDNSCQPTSKIGQENAARLIENSQTFSKTKLAFEWDLQILVKDKWCNPLDQSAIQNKMA